MNLKELGVEIAKIGLPLLGAAIPVPGGAALGVALASAIGAASDKPEDVISKLATPEGRQAALEFQARHEERMVELTSDAEQRGFAKEVEDRNSARQREIQINAIPNTSWLTRNMTTVLALTVIVSTFGLCAFLAMNADGDLKPSQERLFIFILGAVIPLCTMVVSYYFGSSRGDAANSQHIRDIINRNQWH